MNLCNQPFQYDRMSLLVIHTFHRHIPGAEHQLVFAVVRLLVERDG